MDLPQDYRWWRQVEPDHRTWEAARFRVGIMLVPLASLANVFAVFEDLAAVNNLPGADQDRPSFAARILGSDDGTYLSLSGARIEPHGPIDRSGPLDAVVLPTLYDDGYLSRGDGGPLITAHQRPWLHDQHGNGALFLTMCSGVYALAESGLVDGWEVAMHPLYAPSFSARFPAVGSNTRRSVVVSGERKTFISGGHSTYSADVSLYLIARFLGPEAALAFARLYQKDWTAPQEPGRPPAQAHPANPAPDLTVRLAQRFILGRLNSASLVSAAAAVAHLDERTFARRFERATGLKPSAYVLQERMRRARDLLSDSRMPIEDVAGRVGYRDRSAFAKAFKAQTGETPAGYRMRTQAPNKLVKAEYGLG